MQINRRFPQQERNFEAFAATN
ncbi:Protein of unknown function [Pyronema omphalodes CBS 100304]|uniref:Uncharacterized protein n=1 Tax=Pyronema omphalodes (strain CBS 100304) TaxID=1076935 RepID=U4LQB5_PYROM|nr:Protein of unknown function [Pyronema omphalodes CBS 100304]